MEQTKLEKDIQDIKEKISNKTLNISRIAPNTFKRFKQIANHDDFCSDYGNCLKYLIDFHDGIVVHGNDQILTDIKILYNEIEQIKTLLTTKDEPKKRVMMNGRGI